MAHWRPGYIVAVVFGVLAIIFGLLTIYLIWRRHRQQAAFAASARARGGRIDAPSSSSTRGVQDVERGPGKDNELDHEEDVDGEPWPPRKNMKGKKSSRGGGEKGQPQPELPPPAPGPFSYM